MRKTKMFVLASAAAMAASTLSVPATENVTAAEGKNGRISDY